MRVVREVEKDVVGLDEARHLLERAGRRGGMVRGRRIKGEMVVGEGREGGGEGRRTPSILSAIPI